MKRDRRARATASEAGVYCTLLLGGGQLSQRTREQIALFLKREFIGKRGREETAWARANRLLPRLVAARRVLQLTRTYRDQGSNAPYQRSLDQVAGEFGKAPATIHGWVHRDLGAKKTPKQRAKQGRADAPNRAGETTSANGS